LNYHLVVFINDPKELVNILSKLRFYEFKDLKDTEVLHLGHSIIKGKRKEKFKYQLFQAGIILHAYFGFNENLISKRIANVYIKNFEKFHQNKKV
jgi:hypothetical protein